MPPPPRTTLPPQHISNVSVIKAGRQNAMAPPRPPLPLTPMPCLYGKINTGVAFLPPHPHPTTATLHPSAAAATPAVTIPVTESGNYRTFLFKAPRRGQKTQTRLPFPCLRTHTHAPSQCLDRPNTDSTLWRPTKASPKAPKQADTILFCISTSWRSVQVPRCPGRRGGGGGLLRSGWDGFGNLGAQARTQAKSSPPRASDPALDLFARSTFSEKHLFLELYRL